MASVRIMRHGWKLIRPSRSFCSLTSHGNAWKRLAVTNVSLFQSPFRFKSSAERVSITFEFADGTKKTVKAKVGDSLLDVVIDENVDIDGFGACEGTLSCSTCHLIFAQKDYDDLPDRPGEEENDMLDLAYELTDTSRLGCQVFVSKKMDGITVQVPVSVADARDV